MLYKIIITQNGKKKKVLYEGDNFKVAKKKYFKVKDKNRVLVPKKTNAYKKTKPVFYELLLLKEKEINDPKYYERDDIGRNKVVDIKSEKWSLLYKCEYFYEEKFTIYGYDTRMETKEIIKKILLKKNKEDVVKQVNYVLNKLLIHQKDNFDIIVCKNRLDTQRLYNVLKEFCETNKVGNILFTGLINRTLRTVIYKKIVKKTGWTPNKVYRSTTRP
jgi:hypothetical protein